MPGGLPARLPVRHRGVAPDVVDGVQLAELGEEAAVRHVGPHGAPQLDPPAPVVGPVVQGTRLQVVCPDVIDIAACSALRAGPEVEGLGELGALLRDGGQALPSNCLEVWAGFLGQSVAVDVVPALRRGVTLPGPSGIDFQFRDRVRDRD